MKTGKENGENDPTIFINITWLKGTVSNIQYCVVSIVDFKVLTWKRLFIDEMSLEYLISSFIPRILSPGSFGNGTAGGGGGGGALLGQSGQPRHQITVNYW